MKGLKKYSSGRAQTYLHAKIRRKGQISQGALKICHTDTQISELLAEEVHLAMRSDNKESDSGSIDKTNHKVGMNKVVRAN
eukprot:1105191-Ditylum_brightwellii.AAC.1